MAAVSMKMILRCQTFEFLKIMFHTPFEPNFRSASEKYFYQKFGDLLGFKVNFDHTICAFSGQR